MSSSKKTDKTQAPKGSIIRAGGKDGPQRIESQGKRWTDEAEERFLDRLASSYNVTYAAARTGFSRHAIYARRRSDPGFAERWQAALEQGYARLELALVKAANDRLSRKLPDPNMPFPEMTVREAITILQLHRAAVTGDGTTRHPGWHARPRKLEEMKASILTKLEAIETHRAVGGGDSCSSRARPTDVPRTSVGRSNARKPGGGSH